MFECDFCGGQYFEDEESSSTVRDFDHGEYVWKTVCGVCSDLAREYLDTVEPNCE